MAAGVVTRGVWGSLVLVLASSCSHDAQNTAHDRTGTAAHAESPPRVDAGAVNVCNRDSCGTPEGSVAETPTDAQASPETEGMLSIQQCQAIASEARQADPGTNIGVAQCQADSDCREFVGPVQKCFDECKYQPDLGSEEWQAAIAEAYAFSAASRLCEEFWENGCQVVGVPCPAPSEVPSRFVCSDGACVGEGTTPQPGSTIDGSAPPAPEPTGVPDTMDTVPYPDNIPADREQVPFRGVSILGGHSNVFVPCATAGADEYWMVSWVSLVGMELGALREDESLDPGAYYAYTEGLAIIGEPGETGIVTPPEPGNFVREIYITELTTYRLVDSVEEGCEQDAGAYTDSP